MGRSSTEAVAPEPKKLIELGYRSVKAPGRDGLAEDVERFNLPPEMLRRHSNFTPLECHFDNITAYELFARCGTQWRYAMSGHRTGLDYAAVIAVAGVMDCADPDTLDRIKYLEMGALAATFDQSLDELL